MKQAVLLRKFGSKFDRLVFLLYFTNVLSNNLQPQGDVVSSRLTTKKAKFFIKDF